nr:hypothetical protein [Deltaproteobacteria bacterium]
DDACPRPEYVEPWLIRMRSAQRVACLKDAFRPRAVARWEAMVDGACWCTANRARVERLADIGRTLEGFGPGADRIDDSLGFVTARPVRLDPTACADGESTK